MKKKDLIITATVICGLSQNMFAWNNQQTREECINDSSTSQAVVELNATHVYDFDFSEEAIKAFEAIDRENITMPMVMAVVSIVDAR